MKGSFFFLRLFLSEELVLEKMPSLAVLLQLTGEKKKINLVVTPGGNHI